jgi:hypothetical protein
MQLTSHRSVAQAFAVACFLQNPAPPPTPVILNAVKDPCIGSPPPHPKSVILSEAERSRRTCHTAHFGTLLAPFNHKSSSCSFAVACFLQKPILSPTLVILNAVKDPCIGSPPPHPKSVILSEAERSRRTCHTAHFGTLLAPFNHKSSSCAFAVACFLQKPIPSPTLVILNAVKDPCIGSPQNRHNLGVLPFALFAKGGVSSSARPFSFAPPQNCHLDRRRAFAPQWRDPRIRFPPQQHNFRYPEAGAPDLSHLEIGVFAQPHIPTEANSRYPEASASGLIGSPGSGL